MHVMEHADGAVMYYCLCQLRMSHEAYSRYHTGRFPRGKVPLLRSMHPAPHIILSVGQDPWGHILGGADTRVMTVAERCCVQRSRSPKN